MITWYLVLQIVLEVSLGNFHCAPAVSQSQRGDQSPGQLERDTASQQEVPTQWLQRKGRQRGLGGGGPKSDCLPQMPLSQAGFPGWPVFNGLSETRQK